MYPSPLGLGYALFQQKTQIYSTADFYLDWYNLFPVAQVPLRKHSCELNTKFNYVLLL